MMDIKSQTWKTKWDSGLLKAPETFYWQKQDQDLSYDLFYL